MALASVGPMSLLETPIARLDGTPATLGDLLAPVGREAVQERGRRAG